MKISDLNDKMQLGLGVYSSPTVNYLDGWDPSFYV